jgi:lysophospholipase L1-like esterase
MKKVRFNELIIIAISFVFQFCFSHVCTSDQNYLLAASQESDMNISPVKTTVTAKYSSTCKRQTDMRSEPVKRIVALGESTTWGYSVSSKDKCWVSQVAEMLEQFQGSKIELINQGIGSNVLTPECPAYKYSAKPSAIERLDTDVIAHNPDMVFLSYGLNDSRGGTPPEVFRKAYQQLIDRIRSKINPVIVIVNTYYMHEEMYRWPHWDQSNYDTAEIYNLMIKQLAEENNLILADIYTAEVGVDWIIDLDHCHPNDLGHRIIANRVFEAITRNCSFVACQMPKYSLFKEFVKKYKNGPDIPSSSEKTKDVIGKDVEK